MISFLRSARSTFVWSFRAFTTRLVGRLAPSSLKSSFTCKSAWTGIATWTASLAERQAARRTAMRAAAGNSFVGFFIGVIGFFQPWMKQG